MSKITIFWVLTRTVLWQTFVLSSFVRVNKIYMRMKDLIRFFLTEITDFPTTLCFFNTVQESRSRENNSS